MNVDMISYADAEALSNHLKEESKESKGYYLNYQLDIKTFDDLVAHKLLFDYQIIAFRCEKDYIVFCRHDGVGLLVMQRYARCGWRTSGGDAGFDSKDGLAVLCGRYHGGHAACS